MNNYLRSMNKSMKIDFSTIKQYQTWLKEKGLKDHSIRRKMVSLRKFLDWLEQKGLIGENPLKEKKKTGPIILAAEQKRKLITFLKYGFPTLVLLVIILLLLARTKLKLPQQLPVVPTEEKPEAFPVTSLPYSPWIVFYKGKLAEDEQPLVQKTKVIFKIYDQSTDGQPLWTSKTWELEPDLEGNFFVPLGDTTRGDTQLPSPMFFQNEKLYLGISVDGQKELSPRSLVSTAAHSADAYLLQEHPPAEQAGPGNVPILNSQGQLTLAAAAPKIKALNDTFAIEGQAITIQTPFASDGDITLTPDGSGTIKLRLSNTNDNSLDIQNANLSTGSLIGGWVGNDTTNFDLLNLSAGSTKSERFVVSALGDMELARNATIGESLNVSKNINLGQYLYHSNDSDTFLNFEEDSLKMEVGGAGFLHFSEGTNPDVLIGNYNNDNLDFRWDGDTNDNLFFIDASEERIGIGTTTPGHKLDVDGSGNFSGDLRAGRQLQVGQYTTNPTAIGGGSLIYNSTDKTLYYYDGTSWLGTGQKFWQRNSGALAPFYLTDDLLLGAKATSSALIKFTGISGGNSWINTGNVGIGTTGPLAKLHNAGGTLFGTLAVANLSTGGDIGTAANTVDKYTSFNLTQTTASQTITLPNPTNTTAGRLVYVSNTGTASFSFYSSTVSAGDTTAAMWDGNSWNLAGGGGGVSLGSVNNSTLHWNSSTNQWVENTSVLTQANPTANGSYGLSVTNTGIVAGTGYAGYFSKTGAATTNVGLYVTASGATNNYAAIFNAGNVGIGTANPSAKLDIVGDLEVNGYATVSSSLALGTASAPAGPGNLTLTGTIDLGTNTIYDGNLTGNWNFNSGSLSGLAGLTFDGTARTITNANQLTLSTSGASNLVLSAGRDITFDDDNLTSPVPLSLADNALNASLGQGIIDAINDAYDAATGAGGTSGFWKVTDNLLYPKHWSVYDLGIGSNATSSALFFAPSSTNRNAFFNLGTGNLGIGTTNPTTGKLVINGNLDLIGGYLYDSDSNLVLNDTIDSGNINVGYGSSATLSTYDTNENLTLDPNGTGDVYFHGSTYQLSDSGDLTIGGRITFENAAYIQNESDGTLYFNEPTLQLVGSTAIDIDSPSVNLSTQATDIEIADNTASSLTISQGNYNYLLVTTTDNQEVMTLDLPIGGATSLTGNLFISDINKNIYLGTGTGVDNIYIGTGGTGADVINIGSANAGAISIDTGSTLSFDSVDTTNLTMTANDAANKTLTIAATNAGAGSALINLSTDTLDLDATTEIQIDGALTDIGGGTYTHADGDNDLGVAGDLEVSGNFYSPTSGVSGYWRRTEGSLAPYYITDDINIGAIATSSALVHLPGLTNQNAWFNLGTGNVGIGLTNPSELLDVAGQVEFLNNFQVGGITGVDYNAISDSTTTSHSLSSDNDLFVEGDVEINGNLYTDIAEGVAGFWRRTLGSLAPTNITDDVNLGAIATASALVHLPGLTNKNAFFNLGTGNVGIGLTNPSYALDVNGNAIRSGAGTAARVDMSGGDLLVSDDVEINGGFLYVDNIANDTGGTSKINLAYTGAEGGDSLLANGSWLLKNDGNLGEAALMIDQTKGGDIFTASASGSPKFTIKKSGNVGIGTTAPTSLLYVTGDFTGYLTTFANTGTTTGKNGLMISTNADGALALRIYDDYSNNDLFSVSTATMSANIPASFNAQGDVAIANDLQFTNLDASYIKSDSHLYIKAGSPNEAENLYLQSAGTGDVIVGSGTTYFKSNGDVEIKDGSTSRMFVDVSTGYVGIGTTGPTNKLTIEGGNLFIPDSSASYDPGDSSGPGIRIGYSTSGDYGYINANNTGVAGKNLLLQPGGGYVGIGLTNPTSRLEVSGNMEISGYIQQDAWSVPTLLNSWANYGGGWAEAGYYLDKTCSVHLKGLIRNGTVGAAAFNLPAGYVPAVSELLVAATNTTGGGGRIDISSGGPVTPQSPSVNSWVSLSGIVFRATGCAGGADLAEHYPSTNATSIETGDVVSIDPQQPGYIMETNEPYDSKVMGVIATHPGMVLGEAAPEGEGATRTVALSGRVPAKISTKNGPIFIGDYLTSSTIPGFAVKATQAGNTIGKPLEPFNPQAEGRSCPEVSSIESIVWPEDLDGKNSAKPCFKLPDGTYVGKIMTFVDLDWRDPGIILTNAGDITINSETYNGLLKETTPETLTSLDYSIKDAVGQTITTLGAFKDLVVGGVKAALVDTTNLIADTALFRQVKIEDKLISPIVEATQINTEKLTSTQIDTDRIQINKDATVSGSLFAQVINAPTAHFSLLTSEEITTSTISARIAKLNKIYADEIVAGKIKADDIEGLKDTISDLVAEKMATSNKLQATSNPDLSDLSEFSESSESASLLASINSSTHLSIYPFTHQDYLPLSSLDADSGIFNEYLAVLGQATITNLAVTNSLTVENTLHLTRNSIGTIGCNSTNSQFDNCETLYLQPSGLGGIDLLAGKFIIDESGDVHISGDVYVAGKVHTEGLETRSATVSGSLFANLIKPLNKDLVIQLNQQPNNASQAGKLRIEDANNNLVASIDASGSAKFNKLLIASAEATPSGTGFGQIFNPEVKTNASAGKATLKAGTTEIKIFSPYLTDDSLVYITPQSDTGNKVLYVKSKNSCQLPVASCQKSFTVAVDKPITKDVEFNWWIIN